MGIESLPIDESESGEFEEVPHIPEVPAEIPPSWNPPSWTPESPPVEQDSTDESPTPEPIEDESVNKPDSKGAPLGGGVEGVGGGDISIQPPPGAADDPGATTDDPGPATDDPNATDQPGATGSVGDDQPTATAYANNAGKSKPQEVPTDGEGAPPSENGNGPKSGQGDAEIDKQLKQLDELRRQQDEELKQDLKAFEERPKPAYLQTPANEAVAETASNAEEIKPLAPEVVASVRQQLREQYPGIDYENLKYEIGSPHEDYQLAKDLAAAERRLEISRSANTADSLPDAIDTTMRAAKEAKGEQDKMTAAMDEWMLLKYGPTPYTTEAYPKTEDDPDPPTQVPDETETE